MQTFISETIADILNTTSSFENVTLVLPSQRAGVFVKQSLKKDVSNGFLPRILNIEHFIEDVSEIKKADAIQLLFHFYAIYKSIEKDPDSFDVFSSWAFTVLQDFNEIDQHLINTKDVFMFIRDVERLRKWSVKGTFKETELIKDHFAFTEQLNDYYNAFYSFLTDHNIGYQGVLYRESTKKIASYLEKHANTTFIFIGFNALNKAEEFLFKTMLNHGNTKVYWDIDEAFLNSGHQAGTFIRRYKTEWAYYQKNKFTTIGNWFGQPKHIQLIGATKNIAQIKYVGEILEQQTEYHNTALVLADETLLPVTLNSLPPQVNAINITMGYPLKDIPVTHLIFSVFQLFITQEKLQKAEADVFYYNDVIRLIKQPLIYKLLLVDDTSFADELTYIISKDNNTFVSKQQLQDWLKKAPDTVKQPILALFKSYTTIDEFLSRILNLINRLKENTVSLEKEFLFRFYTAFTQLQNLQLEFQYFNDLKTLSQFFRQLIASENLSFQGEPLHGLQLMGMLETRVLDFETVIITSVNEGVLPANTKQTSFIPFDAKVHFGLPTYREKDTIFSYHFFRLIQRAKKVMLIYNTESDSYGGGEKSRFVTQLELLKDNIKTQIISPIVITESVSLKEVKKDALVEARLKELAQKGISPSALTNYLYNPIAFYKQKILKVKEFDNVEEEVAFNTLGTVVHETLEELYKPFVGQFITLQKVLAMKDVIRPLIQKHFAIHFKNGDITTGKNRLIYEVAVRFVQNFITQEATLLKDPSNQLKIIATEANYEAFIPVDSLDFPVKIHGQVDRVDELNGVVRIIDYKTGLVKDSDLKITDFSTINSFKYHKAIQVLLYAYMYSYKHHSNQPIEAGIISFKNLQSGFLKLNFSEKRTAKDYAVTPERIQLFIDEITLLIKEIYNPSITFKEPKELPF